MLGGYANRVGWVDLSTGAIDYRPVDEDDARKYIGARGLGVKYVFDNGPDVDALGPDNILCFMNGPATGTNMKMSGRMAVVTKSPLTGTVTDSHHGGWSAARLRWAGFDGLVFQGRAEQPVYAFVEDGEVTLHDASEVWGKGVHDTVEYFRDKYGDDALSVIAIGQAGENLVRFGALINEMDRASGRGGTGAVAGSKNLKAVVIKSPRNIPMPADLEAFKVADKKAVAAISDEANVTAPRKGGLSVYGTNVLMNIANEIGALPTRNSQHTAFTLAGNIAGEWVNDNILVNDPTCHACPVACKKEVEIHDGKYAGLQMESAEYESMWALGANCNYGDARAIAFMIDRCNDYGMDTIESGNALAVAMEATEKGVNPDGAIRWADDDAMVELLRKIAFREGIGDDLADGPARAAEKWGAPHISMSVKGQSIPAYDPRGMKGMGIAYATSNRGACHLRAYTPASELGLIPLVTDPLAWEGKGELTKVFQDLFAFMDSMDVCKFSSFAEGAEEYAAQYSAITGLEITADDVMHIGERIYNLERYYNNLAGHAEGSDYLPARFLEEPSTMPGSDGHVCELDDMLVEYYSARGWVNGVVPEDKLRGLEIID